MKQIKKETLFALLATLLICVGCDKNNDPPPDNELNGRTTAIFNPDKKYGTVTDIEGNVYKTIVIGKQTWMAENLRVTRFRNGDAIPNITDNDKWSIQAVAAYCNYNNTEDLDTIATYGRLYNWYAAADSRNIAPKGWRVATPDDWNILIDYLGGETIAGGKLKEAGNEHWESPNEADNSSGFTAQPGGFRFNDEDIKGIALYGYWWSTGQNGSSAARLQLFSWSQEVYKEMRSMNTGYSIRCIKE
ncbi:fibrobacter succinogenes major paralogous domain-containing protein [Carboxylicivirga sp. RSCT41]|uniref:fibrobacter succinogenes major paralogous domain-containing protein n=1 Tax=Carboxylicivirga agarovorans TaxID=3417570 RepID=UPI003D344DA9